MAHACSIASAISGAESTRVPSRSNTMSVMSISSLAIHAEVRRILDPVILRREDRIDLSGAGPLHLYDDSVAGRDALPVREHAVLIAVRLFPDAVRARTHLREEVEPGVGIEDEDAPASMVVLLRDRLELL